ncbi:MAG: RNA-protein complex protein Nop10 [Methanolobus sp.]|nr:RNA-protein complex protein Nop10 [Methanolobus sp.]
MGHKILICRKCGKYALETACSKCGSKTAKPQPARFSPKDSYGKYRRLAKKEGNL